MTQDFTRARRWTHPKCSRLDLPADLLGPFVLLGDGRILTIENGDTIVSGDDGATWSEPRAGADLPALGLMLRTRDGTLVLVYNDSSTFKWGWVDETSEPIANVRGDVWTVRSLTTAKRGSTGSRYWTGTVAA